MHFSLLIFAGVVAEAAVMEDMLSAKEKGDEACECFIEERLRTSSKDVFARVPQIKLKTFRETKQNPKQQKLSAVKASRTIITRILIASRVRNISLQSVLKYNLSGVPLAIANENGTLMKTDKSKLGAALRAMTDNIEDIHAEVVILDAMAILQQQVYLPNTFGELAKKLLRQIIAVARACRSERVDFVADRYLQPSIKQQERDRRYKKETRTVHITRCAQDVPMPFNRYLSSNDNKEELLRFLAQEWARSCTEIPPGLEVFYAHGLVCQRLTTEGVEAIPELQCDHEEADTRMLLHAQHALATYGRIMVQSPDTDVLVLSIAFALDISAELFVSTGHVNAMKNVSATAIGLSVTASACTALIGMHCFTGCDSISAVQRQVKGTGDDAVQLVDSGCI